MARKKARLDSSTKIKEKCLLRYEMQKAKKIASLGAALSKQENVPPNHPAIDHPDSCTANASPWNEEESVIGRPKPPPSSSNQHKTPSPQVTSSPTAKSLDIEKTLEHVAAATEYVLQLSDDTLSHKDKMKILRAMKTSDFVSSIKQLICEEMETSKQTSVPTNLMDEMVGSTEVAEATETTETQATGMGLPSAEKERPDDFDKKGTSA